MRWVIGVLIVLVLPLSAAAGDFDVLRGSVPTYHWGGVYGGVQGGYSSSTVSFGTAASSELGFLLRNTTIEQDEQVSAWTVLGSRSPVSTSYGGFVGYNYELEDIIVGVELNYNRVSFSASTADSITRSFTDSGGIPTGHNYFYTVDAGAKASFSMSDIATLRVRGGWEAGIFLPYVFGGFALGRADTSTTATLQYSAVDFPDSELPPLTPLPNLFFGPVTQSTGQNNAWAYGGAVGLGLDVAVLPNVFLRAEAEYIYFAPVNGIQASIATGRVGAGLKF